jgi:Tol biopolymer transport system component
MTLILPPGLALDSQSSEKARPQWTVNDTLKIVVMSGIDISPYGSRVAYVVKKPVMTKDESKWQHQIFVTERGANNTFPLTEGESSSYSPKWSPNGRWIAFLSDRSGDDNIWIISTKGGEASQVTDVDTEVLDFKWSTDGKTLGFLAPDPRSDKEQAAIKGKDDAHVKGQYVRMNHLWAVAWPGTARSCLDGGYELARITEGNFSVLDWDWSPDGKSIAFSHAASPEPADEFFSDLSTVDLETGKVTSLMESDAMEKSPLYSPDGRWIAYSASDLPPADFSAFYVYLVLAGGGRPRRLAETPDQKPHLLGWSEDGKRLYLWEYRGTTTAFSALPADGSEPEDVSAQGGVMDV